MQYIHDTHTHTAQVESPRFSGPSTSPAFSPVPFLISDPGAVSPPTSCLKDTDSPERPPSDQISVL